MLDDGVKTVGLVKAAMMIEDGQQSEEQQAAKQQAENRRTSVRERSRQWFLTIGTVLALLTTIIGFLSDSVGVWEFLKGSDVVPQTAESQAAKESLVALGSSTPTPTDFATSTMAPTEVSTATPVVTPTATPLPVVAAENERLLIVAQFANFASDASFNVAGRIHEALNMQVRAARLEDTRVAIWPEIVSDNGKASAIITDTKAALMIWGEYDSGRVRVRFTLAGGGAELDWQRLLGAPTELSTTINLDVPRETQALALMALGRLYRTAGDMTRARAAFAQALAQQPSHVDTVATLTFYLAVLDAAATPPGLDRAIEGYTKVIEMRPQWFNARYNRGLAYLMRYWEETTAADLNLAIDDFTWTLGIKADYAEAYINRAIAYYARHDEGDLDASIADLTAAIQYNPASYRAFYNRGLSFIRLDRPDRWIADLKRSLELSPTFWVANHALCWGYALDEMAEEAMPYCDEAVAHDASGSTRDARGLALAELERLDEAVADFEQYLAWLDTQPEVWSALNNRHIYEDILEGLRRGENRVTPETLAQLR